jgi:hypothetical protein
MTHILLMGPPCPPFHPCWCQKNPTHPKCNVNSNVPINGGIEFLLLAGVILIIWAIKTKKILL